MHELNPDASHLHLALALPRHEGHLHALVVLGLEVLELLVQREPQRGLDPSPLLTVPPRCRR